VRKPIIAGNWKMNLKIAEGVALVEALKPLVADVDNVEVVVCPMFTALDAVAKAVCEALGAISCVASLGGESAGAFGAGRLAASREHRDGRRANASLVVARDPSGRTDLTLAVTLPHPPGEGQSELLDFVAAVGALVAGR